MNNCVSLCNLKKNNILVPILLKRNMMSIWHDTVTHPVSVAQYEDQTEQKWIFHPSLSPEQ